MVPCVRSEALRSDHIHFSSVDGQDLRTGVFIPRFGVGKPVSTVLLLHTLHMPWGYLVRLRIVSIP